jgi:hypothetical protein
MFLVVLVEPAGSCGEGYFHLADQRFTSRRTLWGLVPVAGWPDHNNFVALPQPVDEFRVDRNLSPALSLD